jgi:hypothetical protein
VWQRSPHASGPRGRTTFPFCRCRAHHCTSQRHCRFEAREAVGSVTRACRASKPRAEANNIKRRALSEMTRKDESMAKSASGSGGADGSVADQLRKLGMKGVLVQMAERGQLLELKCEMPQCYHHRGRGAFDQVTTPRTKWAPSPDHYPTLKSAGGHLRLRTFDLPTSGATTGTMGGGRRSGRCSRKASRSPRSPRS